MSKFKIVLVITVSTLLMVITIFTIVLSFINDDLFKLINYIESNYDVDLTEVIDEYYEIEDENIISYVKTIDLLTNNFTKEESLDIVMNYSNTKVNVIKKYSMLFRYSKYTNEIENVNINSNNTSDIDLVKAIEFIYDLDNRLNNYSYEEILEIENDFKEISNSNTNDISLVKLKNICNFIGYLTYDLNNLNYFISFYLEDDIFNELEDSILLITYYLKELSSNDVLELIDIIRDDLNNNVIYFSNLIYIKSNELNLNNINNEFNMLFNNYNINLDLDIIELGKYFNDHNIKYYNKITDESIKNKIDLIVLELEVLIN